MQSKINCPSLIISSIYVVILFVVVSIPITSAWQTSSRSSHHHCSIVNSSSRIRPSCSHSYPTTTTTTTTSLSMSSTPNEGSSSSDTDRLVEKYGLEVGLWKSLTQRKNSDNDNSVTSAKDLLKKYGVAYLATSIPLALVSFCLCYVLVDQGVDVTSLLEKVGIVRQASALQAGTVALAYAAHKAASPLRFPVTVLFTPVVAKWLGKEVNNDTTNKGSSDDNEVVTE